MPQMEQLRRVKVYVMNNNLEWLEKGTGFVTCAHVDRLMGLAMIVRSEDDGSIVLESKITIDRSYQKQENTMIVWTESESCDLALSFQQEAGCEEIWMKICEVHSQGYIDVAQDPVDDTYLIERLDEVATPIDLPPCELSKLDEIVQTINRVFPSPIQRESLVKAIEQEDYIPKLIELFHVCEDLGNLDGLHHLYEIFRSFLMLNKDTLLQIMFQPVFLMDVVGCLEYNPAKPNEHVRHREYIQSKASFREVLPIKDKELLGKIHQLYRVIYIQEVILPTPSLFEENLMSALCSYILFSKCDIVTGLQQNELFMSQLFTNLLDDNIEESRLVELTKLLNEICAYGQSLKLEERTKFYQVMKHHGLMESLESILMSEVSTVISCAIDILTLMVECSLALIREYILMEHSSDEDEDNQLLSIVTDQLVDGVNSDLDVQVTGLIKMLISPEPTIPDPTATDTSTPNIDKPQFLQYFYRNCMHKLIAPLMSQTTGDSITKDTTTNAVLLSHILDILSFCVESHSYHIKNYILNKNLLARVLVLMTSEHSHLALAALRFCRRIIGLKEEQYNRYIVKNNLFLPVTQAFKANGCKYNLLNSAIIEMFEYIKTDNNKVLVEYVIKNFPDLVESVDYVKTFKDLKLRHLQELDRIENGEPNQQAQKGIIHGADRYRLDPRAMEEDEETWFEDEEASNSPLNTNINSLPVSILSTPPASLPGAPSSGSLFNTSSSYLPPLPSNFSAAFPLFTGSPRPPVKTKPIKIEQKITICPALQSLMEYEDSDEDDVPSSETTSPAKRPRLSLET